MYSLLWLHLYISLQQLVLPCHVQKVIIKKNKKKNKKNTIIVHFTHPFLPFHHCLLYFAYAFNVRLYDFSEIYLGLWLGWRMLAREGRVDNNCPLPLPPSLLETLVEVMCIGQSEYSHNPSCDGQLQVVCMSMTCLQL